MHTLRPAAAGWPWRRWLAGWLALVLLSGLSSSLLAQGLVPVPPLNARVTDQTGTLSSDQRAALEAKLARLETEHGSQLAILMVRTTAPEDIAAYAFRVADQWKIGRREVGDGVLLVVAKNDRRVRIEVARALEGAIPDLAARRVIDQVITPAFKAGDFAGGLNAGVDRLAALIAGENLPAPSRAPAGSGGQPGTQWFDLAIFLFAGAPIIGAVLSGIFGRKLGSLGTGLAVGGLSWWFTASLVVAGIAALAALVLMLVMGVGGGISPGHGRGRRHHTPIIWGGGLGGGGGFGSGGGGGFSSGGGGSFGGGGSSGSW
ncbi:TPM domain-containing protein [Aquabacterium sp. A7-Y]|uniref:TPM domain-containing protein n=1 Tax=Aquabacterium sp. A7-Y TaxID=1349605 RepID=UPI00223D1A1B|nr:TPM domain-containing protein [Aquabacterium sp. A7-Y]MCW7539540.1 TPM domain-containing protein [Aquabacterium sp. A7-Y]